MATAVFAVLLVVVVLTGQQGHAYKDSYKILFPDDPVNRYLPNVCGRAPAVKGLRIVGGTPATPGQYPWMALIYTTNPDNSLGHHCTGSLITKQHILTAAHCFNTNNNPKDYLIRIGEYDQSRADSMPPGVTQNINIESIQCHENYIHDTFQADICILKLARPVKFNKYVQPICLPLMLAEEDFTNQTSIIAGWGDTSAKGSRSNVLLHVPIRVYGNDECVNDFGLKGVSIYPGQMCAGLPEMEKDACYRDSGGPLMVNVAKKFFEVGVVSFGVECANPDLPGAYTRVTYYLDWIKKTIINLGMS